MQQAYKELKALNADLRSAGAWASTGGLHPTHTATVVRPKGAPDDGPYAETKEQLGSFRIIAADDLDAGIAGAAKGSEAGGAPVEVRPFRELEARESASLRADAAAETSRPLCQRAERTLLAGCIAALSVG